MLTLKAKRWLIAGPMALLVGALLMSACYDAQASTPTPGATTTASAYVPQKLEFTITAVPLLTHEMQDTLTYLKDDFAAGGLLANKEVFGFYPSTVTVYQGDTVTVNWVNPSDDPHTIVIPGLGVNVTVQGKATADSTFAAAKPGVYLIACTVDEHSPYMWGQVVVLPDSAAAQN